MREGNLKLKIAPSSKGTAAQQGADGRYSLGSAQGDSDKSLENLLVQDAPARDDGLSAIPRYNLFFRLFILVGGAVALWALIWWMTLGRS